MSSHQDSLDDVIVAVVNATIRHADDPAWHARDLAAARMLHQCLSGGKISGKHLVDFAQADALLPADVQILKDRRPSKQPGLEQLTLDLV